MKITLENGKEVKISKESYKAIVEASKEDEGTIVPQIIAHYNFTNHALLINPGDNKTCMFCEDDKHLRVYRNNEMIREESNLKLVKVNSIKDIKVGDLVRYTDSDDWSYENGIDDMDLKLVTKITDDSVFLQFFENRQVSSCYTSFVDWNNWQVSRRIE